MQWVRGTGIGMLAIGLVSVVHAGDFMIKDGQSRADIVVSATPTRGVKLAARELQSHLLKIAGAPLAIVTAPGTNVAGHIYVGRSSWTDALGVKTDDLQRDMYRVASGDRWLALVGHDADYTPSEPWCKSREDRERFQREWEKRTGKTWLAFNLSTFKAYNKPLDIWAMDGVGSLYAVYDYLRSLGVEWYLPGEVGEVIPKAADIPWPKVSKTVKPEVGNRSITFVDFFAYGPGVTDSVLWYFRLGLGSAAQGFGHSMQVILSDANNRTNHPEYYALYNGKRDFYSRGGKPCLSSEGLYSNMVAYVRAYFDTYPEATAFPVMPTDGFSNMCQCELCKGKDTPNRGYQGLMSDYVWGFVNRVAGEIEKSHPGKKIGCCPYGTYYLPPEKVALHTNVIAMICRWRQHDTGNREGRAAALAVRDAWKAKLAPGSLYTWDYYLNSRPGEQLGRPIFFPHAIAEDLKSWRGVLQGEGVESWKNGGAIADPGLNHLNIFVTSRFYWDAGQDVDRLLDTYYRRFFGPAATEMKGFYERAERSFTKYQADDVRYLMATLKEAEGKANTNTVYGRRVGMIRSECEAKLRELLMQTTSTQEYARIVMSAHPGPVMTMDGRLDEPFWRGYPEQVLRDAVVGEPPKVPTSLKIGCDTNYLYLGVVCREPDMASLRKSGTERDDTNVFIDDAIEVILKTPKHSYYQFAINPNGALVDVDQSQGLSGILWDSGAEAAVARGTNEWTVEMRIPFKAIKGEKPLADKPWHVNVGRNRPRDEGAEVTIFVPAGKRTFHNLDRMAVLAIKEETADE